MDCGDYSNTASITLWYGFQAFASILGLAF